MSAGNKRLLWAAFALVSLSRWLARPPVPDDYDAFGFVLGMSEHFDLSLFQPQFPGYPVFIALGHGLCALGLSGLAAATLISSLASGATAVSLALCAERLAGWRAAVGAVSLHSVAWLPLFLGSSAFSESLGMALAATAFAALLYQRPLLAGVLAGLLLGARASYFPLLLPLFMLAFRQRASNESPTKDPKLFSANPPRLRASDPVLFFRFISAFLIATCAWLVPFAFIVGPRALLALGHIHLSGHFTQWGGSIATRPEWSARAVAMLRDLFLDGVAPSPLALALVAAALAFAWFAARPARASAWILAALAPYALWLFFAQNVIEQPRHALPLVEGLLLFLACALAAKPISLIAASIAITGVTAPLARERRRVLPASAQAANWIAAQPDASRTLIAAGRSARFFRAFARPAETQEHAAMSDLAVTLSRMDSFPARIVATSELDLSTARPPWRWRSVPLETFCRDERIDRARPCLSLVQLVWSPR